MSEKQQIMFQMQLAEANSAIAEEKRQDYESSIADFKGVAQGTWVQLNKRGTGIVEYKGKQYKTLPEGKTSIAAGTKVSIEYRKGYYVSFW